MIFTWEFVQEQKIKFLLGYSCHSVFILKFIKRKLVGLSPIIVLKMMLKIPFPILNNFPSVLVYFVSLRKFNIAQQLVKS